MVSAQTEGDTGYDYNDAYDDEYEDESGQTIEIVHNIHRYIMCTYMRMQFSGSDV